MGSPRASSTDQRYTPNATPSGRPALVFTSFSSAHGGSPAASAWRKRADRAEVPSNRKKQRQRTAPARQPLRSIMTMRIRQLDAADDAIVVSHYLALWESYGTPLEAFAADAHENVLRFLGDGRDERTLAAFAAEVDGVIAGSAACSLHLAPLSQRHQGGPAPVRLHLARLLSTNGSAATGSAGR